MAMQDTMGDAAALTGGYGNSYAATAGQQAYQSYLQGLNDRIPGLRDFAYNAWLNEGDRIRSNLSTLQGLDESDYARYRDTVGDYKDELNYYYNRFGDMSDREYNRYLNDASAWEKDRDYWFNKWQWEQDFNYKTAMDAAAAAAASLGSGRRGGSSGKGATSPLKKKMNTGSGRTTVRDVSSTSKKKLNTGSGYMRPSTIAWQTIENVANNQGKYAAQDAYNDYVRAGILTTSKEDKNKLRGIQRSGR